MVTHACGPEKIDKVKAMNIGVIEIDLPGYRADLPARPMAISSPASGGPRVRGRCTSESPAASKNFELGKSCYLDFMPTALR